MKKPGKMTTEVLKNVFKKPATVMYPFEKAKMPEKFRGKIIYFTEKCIGCKMCVRDCPSLAININKVADKKFEAVFDLDRCIYCAQCVETCPKKALETSPEFELAQISRDKLKVTFKANVDTDVTELMPQTKE